MKICLYNVTSTIKVGGVETFYWEFAKALQKEGFDVELIAGEGDKIKYPDLQLRQFSFKNREDIPNLGNRFRKWIERVSFFHSAWPYLKKQHYDVFLIRKPLDFFTAWFMKRANPSLTVIFTSGGEDFYGFDRFFSRYVDYMFANSQSNAKIISRRYNVEVPVLPNGVDPERFRPMPGAREYYRNILGIAERPTLISVGRVVGWKGFQLVIEALQDLPEFHYILIGDGEYLTTLKKLAENKKLTDRIHFLGAIDNPLIPEHLNAGDIFIQPSIGYESFGNTLLEAMACGLPVVASRNGGMVDIVKDGINGYLFETGSKEDLVRNIKRCFWERDSMVPRRYVVENFTWGITLEKLLNYLEDSHTA